MRVFLFLFLFVLVHSGIIHLMLDRPFLPLDWEYTTVGSCSLEGTVIDFLQQSLIVSLIGTFIFFVLDIFFSKVLNFRFMKIINIVISATLYIYIFFFLTHLDEKYCEVQAMYDKYLVFYFIHFVLVSIVFYFFKRNKVGMA